MTGRMCEGGEVSEAPVPTVAGGVPAIVAETARKAPLAWVGPPGNRQQAVWCTWHDEALLVLTGGSEQPNPGLTDGGSADVTLRSKDKGVRVTTFRVDVRRLPPEEPEWADATALLKESRLNAVDAATATQRWAAECDVWRLAPTGELVEQPGAMSDSSHRAAPEPTPAATAGDPPLMVGRAPGRRSEAHR